MISMMFRSPDNKRSWTWTTPDVLVGHPHNIMRAVAGDEELTHEAIQLRRIKDRCERALRQGSVGHLGDHTVGLAECRDEGHDFKTVFTCVMRWVEDK
jgi:hypothetical protein